MITYLNCHSATPKTHFMITLNKTHLQKCFVLASSLLLFIGAFSQVKYSAKKSLSLTLSGTSTLHDWDMKSSTGTFEANFVIAGSNTINTVNELSFSTKAESLKSGHDAMDKNAYVALKSDKFPLISYTSNKSTIIKLDASTYSVKTTGKLTIAGTTLDEEIDATCKVNSDKSITVMGSKKISMKDFGMSAPTFMMGTVQTGNDVVLKFDMKLTKF
jgi:polyisoprenoid-binding protein YceI